MGSGISFIVCCDGYVGTCALCQAHGICGYIPKPCNIIYVRGVLSVSFDFPQLGILNCTVLVLESATAGLMALDRGMASTLYSTEPDAASAAAQLTPRDGKPTLYGMGELRQQVRHGLA